MCSGKAFLLPRGPPDVACLLHFGHRGPSVLLPINRITTITSAGMRWALWNSLGDGGRSSHHAVLLRGERTEKESKTELWQMDGSLGLKGLGPRGKGLWGGSSSASCSRSQAGSA